MDGYINEVVLNLKTYLSFIIIISCNLINSKLTIVYRLVNNSLGVKLFIEDKESNY